VIDPETPSVPGALPPQRPAAEKLRKRRTLIGLAVLVAVLFLVGVAVGYVSRKNSICRDDKPPIQQQDTGLGQILFRCAYGQVVTSND
jgi:hypothetical protein